MDEVFEALGDPTRRWILRLLRSGDLSAGRIAEEFPVAKSTLFGHLNVLEGSNLVVTERSGATITCRLDVGVYEEMLGAAMELLGWSNTTLPESATPLEAQASFGDWVSRS